MRCKDCSQVVHHHHHSARVDYSSHAHIINGNLQASRKWEMRCCRSPYSRGTPERKGICWVRGEQEALQAALQSPEQDAPLHLTDWREYSWKQRNHSYQTAPQNPVDLLSKWFNSITILSNVMTLFRCLYHERFKSCSSQLLYTCPSPLELWEWPKQDKYVMFLNTLQNFARYKNLNKIELNEENTGENKINSKIQVFGT